MSRVTCQISVSLDGFVAGPNPTLQDPLGAGGERLHEWALKTDAFRAQHGGEGGVHDIDSEEIEEATRGIGAHVMGRRMFGGGDGAWDPAWRGWWGEEPPFRTPVFVVTHYAREPLVMAGGTTFTFVTDGVEAAVEQARAAAGGRDVAIAGGAQTVQQALRAGLLDELRLHVAPVLLGAGTRLFEDVGDPVLEPTAVRASPAATHIVYRIAR